MTRLIEYVLAKAGGNSGISTDSRTKYRQLAKSLAAYIGGDRDEDIIVQARPGWTDGYYRFLRDTYGGNKDGSADPSRLPDIRLRRAADHLRTLRRINYNAVTEGILPDVDFLAGIPGLDLARTRPVSSPDFGAQLRRLIDIKSRDATFAGPIDRYLLCLYLCGLPTERLPEVLGQITACTTSVTLPHLGIRMPLSEALRQKALTVKSRKESKEKEARRSVSVSGAELQRGHPQEEPHTGQDKENNPSSDYSLLFRHLGITLYRSGTPFTDWLSLMMEVAGTAPSAILALMALYDENTRKDAFVTGTSHLVPDLAPDLVTGNSYLVLEKFLSFESQTQKKNFYAVKVYGTTAEDELATLPTTVPGIWPILDGNVWCPCTTSRPTTNVERIVARRGKVVDERRTVMRDLFFARATTADISRLDRAVPNLWVFQTREGTRRRYTRISPLELRAMRSILDRLGPADDIEFSITDTPLPADFAADSEVTLLLPGFENLEARVTKKDPSTGTYTIHLLTPDGKHITMTVPPTAIKALKRE